MLELDASGSQCREIKRGVTMALLGSLKTRCVGEGREDETTEERWEGESEEVCGVGSAPVVFSFVD